MNKAKNTIFSTRDDQFYDELSLLDLVAFFRRNFRALLTGIVLGSSFGLAIAFAIPAQWEATALLLSLIHI